MLSQLSEIAAEVLSSRRTQGEEQDPACQQGIVNLGQLFVAQLQL